MSKLRTRLYKEFPDYHKLDLERLHAIIRDYIFDLESCKTPEAIRSELQSLRQDLTNPVDEINDFEKSQHK